MENEIIIDLTENYSTKIDVSQVNFRDQAKIINLFKMAGFTTTFVYPYIYGYKKDIRW